MQFDGKFNVGYNTDNMTFGEALISYKITEMGYIHPIDDLEFQHDDFYEFIKLLHIDYKDIIEYDFSDSKRTIFKQYKHDEFFISAQGNSKEVYISVSSKTLETSLEIFKLYKKFYKDDDEIKIFFTSYYTESGRTNNSTKTLQKTEIDSISDLYYPYIDTEIMYKQYFTLQENILILAGKPGIGKSKMASSILKFATENEDILPYDKTKDGYVETQFINVAYVKSNDVLADDSFWRELEAKEYDFVILDDLDYFLTSRDQEVTSQEEAQKNKFLNQFLSFTDGIEKHRTKFIITTNQPFSDLDSALLRKGRLFDILELRDLSHEEALAIWKENKLDVDDFNELYVYNENERVLPADLGSEIAKRHNDRINDSLSNYLLEQNISKIKDAKNIEKVGF